MGGTRDRRSTVKYRLIAFASALLALFQTAGAHWRY